MLKRIRLVVHAFYLLLPVQFRVIYHQFLLRVIDLEALSIKADVVGFLGQFAGVLIMFSLIGAFRSFVMIPGATWSTEQYLITTMMLVIRLITVISWDAIFPDRRDVMVLAPLPVSPSTILFAKMAASAALLGLAILALNFASGIVCPLRLTIQHASDWEFFQSLAAYWATMVAASLFLYCSVLTVQGFLTILLPRRLFLRLSAILQLTAFVLIFSVYFLQPSITTPVAMAAPENHWILACFPSFWFFALLNQLNGSLPANLTWLAWRAWIGTGIVVSGAGVSLLLCYLRNMKKTVEEPDLLPGGRGSHWTPNFGSLLQTAIVLFSIRSLTRSRHHRVAFIFYLALVFSIRLSSLKNLLATTPGGPPTTGFLISTFIMMSLVIIGLRSVFSLPISLNANWVLRTAQVHPTQNYIAATRRSLLLFAVVPVCIGSAMLAFSFRPFHQTAIHIAVLALVGCILADLSLIGFYKVPFTCSYLPGNLNIQFAFWGFFILFVPLAIAGATYEQRALNVPFRSVCIMIVLASIASGLWAFNRYRAKSAVLYFEEIPPDVITTLGLNSVQGSRMVADVKGSQLKATTGNEEPHHIS